jgi:DNA-binding transcriptional LysR family regulator
MPARYAAVRADTGPLSTPYELGISQPRAKRVWCGNAGAAFMELHQIRYFLALCEELHFTRAAERCAVAQSSLTRAIKALERELGGALFHRERSNTHLTRLGERVKPSLEQAWRHVQAAQQAAQGAARDPAPSQPAAGITPLRARHPEIARRIGQASAETLREHLLSVLDALLRAPSPPAPAPSAAAGAYKRDVAAAQ